MSLLLPVLAPLPACLPLAAGARITDGPLFPLVASLLVGGVPYAVLALLLLRKMRGRDEDGLRRLTLGAPWGMLLLLLLCTGPWGLFAAPYVLAFGYGYVLLAFGLLWVLRRCDVVPPRERIAATLLAA